MTRDLFNELTGDQPLAIFLFLEHEEHQGKREGFYVAYGPHAVDVRRIMSGAILPEPMWTPDGLERLPLHDSNINNVINGIIRADRRVAILKHIR